MSSLYKLKARNKRSNKKQDKRVSFDRNELRILLNEYSRRVAAGEWRETSREARTTSGAENGCWIYLFFR